MAFNFGKKSVFPAQRDDDDETVKVSQAAWNQMQQTLGGLNEKLTRLERKAARAPAPVTSEPAKTKIALHEPKVDLTGLPDPVTDKEGFLKAASQRLQTQLDTLAATIKGQKEDEQKDQHAAAVQANKVNKLWNRWQKEHPEFAKAGKVVQAEASAMVQEGLAQGMGLDAVMFADEDGFLDDLAERVGAELKEMGVEVEKPGKDPAETAGEVDKGLAEFEGMFKVKDEEGAAARARDLAAGDAGSLTPRKGAKTVDKPEPLTDQLRKVQEHMGLI